MNFFFKKTIWFLAVALAVMCPFAVHAQPVSPDQQQQQADQTEGGHGGIDTSPCTITNIAFDPYTTGAGVSAKTLSADGQTKFENFYDDDKRSPVTITISSAHCAKTTIYVTLYSKNRIEGTDGEGGTVYLNDLGIVSTLKNKALVMPENGVMHINLINGEDACNKNTSGPNCSFRVFISTAADGAAPSVQEKPADQTMFYSNIFPQGRLDYTCEGSCTTNWVYQSDDSIYKPTGGVTLENNGSFDETSTDCADKENCYALYGGLSDIFSKLGIKMSSYDTNSSLGAFLNAVFQIIVGIAGILLVLRIMYLGYRYYYSDNVSQKMTVRGAILQSVGGFVLLLLIYTILRLINPDLLNLTPRIDAATIENIEQNAPKNQYGVPMLTGGGSLGNGTNDVLRINKNISDYDPLFSKYAAKYGRDCTFLKADMYRESGGDPDAQSSAGAVGLMQLMPSTAAGLKYSVDDMKNPEKAIEASAKLFQGLSTYACDGKSKNAVCDASQGKYQLAAYNGGPTSNKPSMDSSCAGKTQWECVGNQGYNETRHYVPTVLNNYQSLKDKGWGCQ